jgi:EmrB/QacA subfamily drug resistance transporter
MTDAGTTRPRLSLATLSLVLFLTFLDNTVVSVALSSVQSDLGAGVSGLQWVVGAYALVFASLMLPAGAVSDLFGRKKVMLGGVVIFCVGSLIGALAPDVQVLWAGRAVMGIGAAASEPGTLSVIRHLFPDRRDRAQALGVWAAISGLALAAGPIIGGTLVGVWSWRAIFWFNLAFGLLALAGGMAVLPESSDPEGRRLDVPGALVGTAALAFATFATIAGETSGYSTWWVITLYAAAVVAAVGFVQLERRTQNPTLQVRFFRVRAFSASTFVAFATYFGVFSIFFFVALYLEIVGSMSGYRVALLFLPMAAVMVVASALTGRWVAVSGPRAPMTVGCALAAAGIVLTDVYLTPTAGMNPIAWTLLLAGLGFGIAMVPVTSTAMGVIPPEHSGMAASTTNTSRELGAVAGVAVLGSIVNGQLTVNLVHRLNQIGIPKAYQQEVVTAVTTGSIGGQAASAEHNKSIASIVNEVVTAAYGAFGHGLDLSLDIATSLMAVSAIAAFLWVRRRPAASPEAAEPAAADEPAAAAELEQEPPVVSSSEVPGT